MGGFGVGVTLHFMTSQYQPAINLNSSCKHTHVSSTVSMRRLKVGNSVYVAVASAPVSKFIIVYLLFKRVATTLLAAGLTLILWIPGQTLFASTSLFSSLAQRQHVGGWLA